MTEKTEKENCAKKEMKESFQINQQAASYRLPCASQNTERLLAGIRQSNSSKNFETNQSA